MNSWLTSNGLETSAVKLVAPISSDNAVSLSVCRDANATVKPYECKQTRSLMRDRPLPAPTINAMVDIYSISPNLNVWTTAPQTYTILGMSAIRRRK